MTGLERIKAAAAFEGTDRTPVVGQVFGHAAVLAGVPLREYLRKGELLAQCQLKALECYGYDAVFALMDVSVETEALGSVLEYRKGQYPFVRSYALDKEGDIGGLSFPDPRRDGRMPELLRAARMLRMEAGDRVLVAGCVVGPMTLTVQLMGIEKALYLAADDPKRFGEILDFSTEVIIRFGCAQLEAGVHLPLVFDPSASPAVIPPAFFREFELPRLRQIFGVLSEKGAAANWLHITGPTKPILSYFPSTGADIVNIDYLVDMKEGMELLPTTCCNGNIKPLLFVDGKPEVIASEAFKVLTLRGKRGGFILSPGCEVPPESKGENITALVSAAR